MPSFLKKAISFYKRVDKAIENHFEKKGLTATGMLLRGAPVVIPMAILVSPLLAFGVGMPLTIATAGFAIMAGTVGSLATLGMISGALYIGEKKDQRDKLITMITTNAAGQRVEGNVYDLQRLQEYEQRIADLSSRLDRKDDPSLREDLTKAFDSATAYIRRVRVVEASPLVPDATTYTFVKKTSVTQVVAAPA